ncbi:hypothetical protein DL93DRAFT_2086520 [Clavulina sp. PMI_390]|nr:hypothetical protein DL93DRAFT_2086520 [Clavulina sp. PMI_390]
MPLRDVVAIFPSFDNPDHFDLTPTRRYICLLCPPNPDGSALTFKTDEAALAHEKSKDHVFCVEVARKNPWAPHEGDAADWDTDAGRDSAGMTPEQVKDLEYRQRVDQIPQFVQQWRSGFDRFVKAGDMLPPDEIGRRPRQRNKRKPSVPAVRGTSSSESSISLPPSPPKPPPRTLKPLTFNKKPTTTIAPPVVEVPRPVVPALAPPKPKAAYNSPPVPITAAMRAWMSEIEIEMRFSPTRAREMREFLQLPTDRKVDLVEKSAWDLRKVFYAL